MSFSQLSHWSKQDRYLWNDKWNVPTESQILSLFIEFFSSKLNWSPVDIAVAMKKGLVESRRLASQGKTSIWAETVRRGALGVRLTYKVRWSSSYVFWPGALRGIMWSKLFGNTTEIAKDLTLTTLLLSLKSVPDFFFFFTMPKTAMIPVCH